MKLTELLQGGPNFTKTAFFELIFFQSVMSLKITKKKKKHEKNPIVLVLFWNLKFLKGCNL